MSLFSKYLSLIGLCYLFPAMSDAASLTVKLSDAKKGKVMDAIVELSPRDENIKLSVMPLKPATMTQRNTRFEPFVLPVQLNAEVDFPNLDNIHHHVYSFSPAKVFEIKLYTGRPKAPILFDNPGVVVLGCNIHDSMRAYIYVSDAPRFDKTGATSEVVFDNVPTGEYTVSIWHPHLKRGKEKLTRVIQIEESTPATLALELDIKWPIIAKKPLDNLQKRFRQFAKAKKP